MNVCPRQGCTNRLAPGQIVCSGDFTALAGMCRGKKRLGQPQADRIQSEGGREAYRCPVCRQWHNGKPVRDGERALQEATLTIKAMREEPMVGWRGVLQLADAWEPSRVNRSRWAEGIDQREALTAP